MRHIIHHFWRAACEATQWVRRRWRNAPRQRAYCVVGMLLGLGAPVGLALAHAISESVFPTPAWLVEDIARLPTTYAYVMGSTMSALAILGYLVGRWSDHLHRLSTTDPLTGLFNRRFLEARAADEVERNQRYGTPLSLLVVDLDGLKAINDMRGHNAGDEAIRMVARSISKCMRTNDVPARVGGDEFAVLLPQTARAEALAAGTRIAGEVARCAGAREVALSVSVGVSELDGARSPSLEDLLAAADGALYEAKAAGGGRALGTAGRSASTCGFLLVVDRGELAASSAPATSSAPKEAFRFGAT